MEENNEDHDKFFDCNNVEQDLLKETIDNNMIPPKDLIKIINTFCDMRIKFDRHQSTFFQNKQPNNSGMKYLSSFAHFHSYLSGKILSNEETKLDMLLSINLYKLPRKH